MRFYQAAQIKYACGCEFYIIPHHSYVPPGCPEHWPHTLTKIDRTALRLEEGQELDVATGKPV